MYNKDSFIKILMTDTYLNKNFDTYLNGCFSKFKEKIINNSEEFRQKMKTKFIDFYRKNDPTNKKKLSGDYPFVIIEIKNGTVFKVTSDIKDDRIEHIVLLLKKTMNFYSDKEIPNTKLWFWISDRVPWELEENIDSYPFYVFAGPKNINNIIFPDNTFECMTLHKKYKGQCWDWNQMKELFKKKNLEYKQKQNTIYFKGTPTTVKIHRIREILANYAKTRKNMIISLDGWYNYTPPTELTKYLFLLNLPGHYPWSNRFKYLFLTNSVIININVFTKSINAEGWNEYEYHSFIDLVMKPGEDYVNLSFTYYNVGISKSKDAQKRAQKMTDDEINKIIKQIEDIYNNYARDKNMHDKMISNYREKIAKLNNQTIYEYIYKCIVKNATIIKG
jgi:hypothetical protein